jgi:hypothetical protein
MNAQNEDILKSLKKIQNLQVVKVYENKKLLFFYNFYIGIARGLGTLFAFTVLFALIVFILSQLEWVPIVGTFIAQVMDYITFVRTRASPTL